MKLLLDVKDNKAPFVLELLKSFSYIKVKALTPHEAKVLEDLNEAVENMILIKEGKLKAYPAKDLLKRL